MLQTLFSFLLSAIISLIILYILGIVWFGDKRNQMVRSFFVLGVIAAYWIIFNGILSVTNEQSFPVILSIGMIFVCSLPFALFWFALHYTKSPLVRSKGIMTLSIALPTADVLLMLTNPLHKLYFTDYAFPVPGKGILFWAHVVVCLAIVFLSFVLIVINALKTQKHKVLMLCAGLGTLISSVIHICFALNPVITYDLSSIGFFLTFLLFAFSAHKSRIFNIRRITVDQTFFALDDIFFLFDKDGTMIEHNSAAKTLFPQFFSLGKSVSLNELISDLSPRLLRCTPPNLLKSIGTEGKNCEGEIHLAAKDGQIKAYALRWHAIPHKPALSGYALSLADTSAYHNIIDEINEKNESLIKLTEEALSASKAKSAFLANMSHEIRTPLNAIIGMSHIAKESFENPEKAIASINQILRASKHLLELLNNILDMSKIESGKFALASDPFLLQAALDEVVDIFAQRCDEKEIALVTDIDTPPKVVVGDSLRLKQVIINLLGNAVKFTDSGGNIRLLVNGQINEDYLNLKVSIQDTGIGMSEEQLSRLFNTFEQADSSIAARYGGTGIGLALSQHLVGLMGGIITVESQLGHGSVFSFNIRLPIRAGSGEKPCQEHVRDSLDLSEKRVLVVDDVEINRIIISELLSQTNVIIEEAEDGTEALKLFEKSPEHYYDAVLMDVQMPNMDGYEATRQMRAMSRKDANTLPIVAMTANAYREDVEKALRAGMTAHLTKPVDITIFFGLLAKLIPA